MGSLAGNEVELQARSIRSGSGLIVETAIFGETDGETIRGSFLRADGLGNVTSGEATGFKINPDTSQYRPAATILADTIAPSNLKMETIDEAREKPRTNKLPGRTRAGLWTSNPKRTESSTWGGPGLLERPAIRRIRLFNDSICT